MLLRLDAIVDVLGAIGIAWREEPLGATFDRCLRWTRDRSACVDRSAVPRQSTRLWQNYASWALQDEHYVASTNTDSPRIEVVGVAPAVAHLPAGASVWLSLARRWETGGATDERCHLQWSGHFVPRHAGHDD